MCIISKEEWTEIEALLALPQKQICVSTQKFYQKNFDRMTKRMLFPEQIGAKNRKSYNTYRASLVWRELTNLRELWSLYCASNTMLPRKDLRPIAAEIHSCLEALHRYPPNSMSESLWKKPATGQSRKSKRRHLASLPSGWEMELLHSIPSEHKYWLPFFISVLTGCRPAELKKGVTSWVEKDKLYVYIKGAKVTETSGQEKRLLGFEKIDGINIIFWDLVRRQPHSRLGIKIDDTKKYSDYIRSLSHRKFPKCKHVVSPYSLRHQLAANLKAAGYKDEVISKCLGHRSGRSKQAYGVIRQGRRGSIGLSNVRASHPVHSLPSEQSKRWLEAAPQTQPSHSAEPTPANVVEPTPANVEEPTPTSVVEPTPASVPQPEPYNIVGMPMVFGVG